MAIPPDPIQTLVPQTKLVVEAEVIEVLSTGPKPAAAAKPPPAGTTSTGKEVASQVVKLKVGKVLFGETKATELTVVKPLGAYALRAGNKGPFLLDGATPQPNILGRYGPDSYDLPTLQKAFK